MNGARISKAGLNDFQWPGTRGVLAPLYATSRLPTTAKSTQRRQSLPNDGKVYPRRQSLPNDGKVYPRRQSHTHDAKVTPTTPKSQPLQQQHEKKGNRPANMSDFEDDMDVDAPAARDSLLFSSDNTNTKGKRSAANLPVEAEDSLPW
jgi:hypothetical protein